VQEFFNKSLGVRIGIGFGVAIFLSLFLYFAFSLLSPFVTPYTSKELVGVLASGNWNETDKISIFYLLSTQTMCLFLLPALILLAAIYKKPSSILRENRMNYKDIRYSVFILLILTVVTTNLPGINLLSDINTQGFLKIIGGETSQQWIQYKQMERFTENLLDNNHLLLSIFCMAFIPAFCEEIFFRGFLQTIAIRVIKNQHIAIACTALIFSLMHGDIFNCIPRFILGMLLGYIFLYSRNILFPIIAHTMHNAWVVLLSLPAFPDNIDTIGQMNNYPLLGIASLVILGVFMAVINRKTKKVAITDNLS
jgi:hypothetical protein